MYKAEVALFLTKAFETHMIFYRVYASILNYFLVKGNNYFYIFSVMSIGEFISLFLFVKYFKNGI